MNNAYMIMGLLMTLLLLIVGGKAAAATPQTPALVMRACGPGDSWFRTEVLILSPQGRLIRMEFEESQLEKLKAARQIEFSVDDAEFGDNPVVPLRLKNGMALFACAVGQVCKSVRGHLALAAYQFGKYFTGMLTWSSDGNQSRAFFSATTWLQDEPECM